MPQYTPAFKQFCKEYFTKHICRRALEGINKFNSAALANNLGSFTPQKKYELLKDLERCNQLQLQYINGFIRKAKVEFEKTHAQNQDHSKFFEEVEAKLKECSKALNKKSAGAPGQAQEGHSSYKPSAQSGQSFYDSMMHILGYDATTVGASAIFFLAFSGLRFLVGSPYWEQVAEYNAHPEKQFNPKLLNNEQIALNLRPDSTREEILQAGFLPEPDLASAFNVEFQSFMNKMGKMTKENNNLNPLGAGLLHPRRG